MRIDKKNDILDIENSYQNTKNLLMFWSDAKSSKVNHKLQHSKKHKTYQYSNSIQLLQYTHKYGTTTQN